jgi:hypothetical protein
MVDKLRNIPECLFFGRSIYMIHRILITLLFTLALAGSAPAQEEELTTKFQDCVCLNFTKQVAPGGVLGADFFDTFKSMGEPEYTGPKDVFHNEEYSIKLSFDPSIGLASITIDDVPVVHMDLQRYTKKGNEYDTPYHPVRSRKIRGVYAISDLDMLREVLHRVRYEKGIKALSEGLGLDKLSDLKPGTDRDKLLKDKRALLIECYNKSCK